MSHSIKPLSHDTFFKISMQNQRVFTSFLSSCLPADLQAAIDLKTIQQEDGALISKKLKTKHADILLSACFAGRKNYVYVMMPQLQQLEAEGEELLVSQMLTYASSSGSIKELDQFKALVHKNLLAKTGGEVMTLLERCAQEARESAIKEERSKARTLLERCAQEAREEGITQGVAQEKVNSQKRIISKLLQEGKSLAYICSLLETSEESIKVLQETVVN